MKKKFNIGDFVKHVDSNDGYNLGRGVVVAFSGNSDYVQVNFQNEPPSPPKPLNYQFSANPFVIHIDKLEKVRVSQLPSPKGRGLKGDFQE